MLGITSTVNVHVVTGDIADINKLDNLCADLLQPSLGNKYEQTLLINNAGSVGDVSKHFRKCTNLEVQAEMNCNVTSFIVLTGKFIEHFHETPTAVVNISSLCALQPFASMGTYCTMKAARDMALKVYAKEQPKVICLNYAPGPLETAMTDTLRVNLVDEQIRGYFKKMKEEKTFVKMEDSAQKLIHLLRSGAFQSGDHVDFYDPMPTT